MGREREREGGLRRGEREREKEGGRQRERGRKGERRLEGKERKEYKVKLDGGREQVKKGLGEVYKTDEEGRARDAVSLPTLSWLCCYT